MPHNLQFLRVMARCLLAASSSSIVKDLRKWWIGLRCMCIYHVTKIYITEVLNLWICPCCVEFQILWAQSVMRILSVSLIGEDIRSVMDRVMVYVHLPYNKDVDIEVLA